MERLLGLVKDRFSNTTYMQPKRFNKQTKSEVQVRIWTVDITASSACTIILAIVFIRDQIKKLKRQNTAPIIEGCFEIFAQLYLILF